MGKMEISKMSILVEQVPPAGLLLLAALGVASGTPVLAAQPLPTNSTSLRTISKPRLAESSPPCRVQSLKAWISC